MKHLFLFFIILTILPTILSSCKKSLSENKSTSNTGSDSLPSGASDGVTFYNSGTSAVFDLYAPGKSAIYVIGDFNNWVKSSKYLMKKTTDGNRWWLQVDSLNPNTEYAYQYLIDDSIRVGDPYAHKILDPDNDSYISSSTYPNLKAYPTGKTTGIVSTFQANTESYTWKNDNYTKPAKSNLVIYELLVRDFNAAHTYSAIIDSLSYLASLGINAIELLPINEFEGNSSWGYNPNYFLAPDKYYGTANNLKTFVDSCHGRGIAVIQDIALEDAFSSCPMLKMYWNKADSCPATDNPWFDVSNRHPDAVGYQFNHESTATQTFTENVMKYWVKEFHIDGYRFDQAKGFTQTYSTTETDWAAYDASRIAIWNNYYSYLHSLDSSLYVILEYFSVNSEEAVLAQKGMMLWTNLSNAAEQAAMGYPDGNGTWDLSGLFYDQYNFTSPYGLVCYFESHDEERLMYKNEAYGNSSGSYNIKDISTGLNRCALDAAFLFSSPGPKMIWQFGELGYDISIDYNGRTGEKPILWSYASDANRKALYNLYAKMARLKTKNPVFRLGTFNYSLSGAIKTISLSDVSDNSYVEVIGNFDVANQTASISFPFAGTWYDNISGTSINVPSVPYTMTLTPGAYYLFSNNALIQ